MGTYLCRVRYYNSIENFEEEGYHQLRAESYTEVANILEDVYAYNLLELNIVQIEDVHGEISKEQYNYLLTTYGE